MHDHDELMRLADEMMEESVAGWTYGRRQLSQKLRTLAQGAKTGGVAEPFARGWVHVFPEDSQGGTPGDWEFHDIASCPEPPCPTCRPAIVVLTDAPPPAAQHEGTAVDDAPILPDDETRAAIWPAAARFRAFEWLRALATTDGAPEEAGIALDTWHNTAMELQAAKAPFNRLDKDGYRAFLNESKTAPQPKTEENG